MTSNHSLYLIELLIVPAILRETSKGTSYQMVRLVFRTYTQVWRTICHIIIIQCGLYLKFLLKRNPLPFSLWTFFKTFFSCGFTSVPSKSLLRYPKIVFLFGHIHPHECFVDLLVSFFFNWNKKREGVSVNLKVSREFSFLLLLTKVFILFADAQKKKTLGGGGSRQYRYEPPPEFPLASPYSGIVHHLSGPNRYALTQIYP